MEIERKFRIQVLPPKEILGESAIVAQGYLFTEPGEMRLRRVGTVHYLTVKGDGTLARQEWEMEIPLWVFDELWPKTEGIRIEKSRYCVQADGQKLEVDEYFGRLSGLVTLECEFSSETEARKFRLPDWALGATEVTSDRRFKNKALALRGMPD